MGRGHRPSTAELIARMGHAGPVAALRYQHATEDRDRAIADALSALAGDAAIVPLAGTPRDGRAMDLSQPAPKREKRPSKKGLPPAISSEQPQRDSNPCLHLERVMS